MAGKWFYRLNRLKTGSIIHLRTPQATFTYQVAINDVVHEKNVAVLHAPRSRKAAPRLTLYTCTLPKTNYRVRIVANLVGR